MLCQSRSMGEQCLQVKQPCSIWHPPIPGLLATLPGRACTGHRTASIAFVVIAAQVLSEQSCAYFHPPPVAPLSLEDEGGHLEEHRYGGAVAAAPAHHVHTVHAAHHAMGARQPRCQTRRRPKGRGRRWRFSRWLLLVRLRAAPDVALVFFQAVLRGLVKTGGA